MKTVWILVKKIDLTERIAGVFADKEAFLVYKKTHKLKKPRDYDYYYDDRKHRYTLTEHQVIK